MTKSPLRGQRLEHNGPTLGLIGGTTKPCRYRAEQLKSLAIDTKAVGLWRAFWTSWTEGLTRFGWNRPDLKSKGLDAVRLCA